MKAISLWQPWASLMACGAKRIETRGWPTKVRGAVAIHAAQRWTREQEQFIWRDEVHYALLPAVLPSLSKPLPLGSIIAVGELVDCKRIVTREHLFQDAGASSAYRATNEMFPPPEPELSFGNYEHGRYAWIFVNIRAIDPIPCKGKQGWFEVQIEESR